MQKFISVCFLAYCAVLLLHYGMIVNGSPDTGKETIIDDDDSRIIQGEILMDRILAPWMAYLWNDRRNFGGSLISNRVILTSASCVRWWDKGLGKAVTTKRILYTLGGLTRIQGDECPTGEFLQVQDDIKNGAILHPDYDAWYLHHNVALIQMVKEVVFTEYISPILLAPSNPVEIYPEGFPVIIIGWGSTEDNVLSEDLRFAETEVRSKETCEYFWACPSSPSETLFRYEYQVCYSGQGTVSRCEGDQGGPVVTELGPKAVQIAINSHYRSTSQSSGQRCPRTSEANPNEPAEFHDSGKAFDVRCRTEVPTVGTKIAYYRAWIQSNADALTN